MRDMDRSVLTGIAWTGGAKWATQVLSWGTTILVARLLTQQDYGVVGMAMVYLGLAQVISELGISAAIVQRRDLTEEQIARVGGLAVLVGLAFTLLAAALAGVIAAFFHEPAVAAVQRVLGLTFVISSFWTVPYALQTRDLPFRQLALVDTAEALTLTAVTFAFALAGYGYWAIALGAVCSRAAAAAIATAQRPHRIALPVPLASIRGAIRIGADVVVSRLAWYAYSNADFAVVGRWLGSAALGAYTIGWTIATIPVSRVHQLYHRVTSAVFSAVQHDQAAVARYVAHIAEGVACVSFPASIGLALVADLFVAVVLGPRWTAAVTPMRLLALSAVLRSLDPLLAQVMINTGHSRWNARTMVTAALTMPLLFVAGARWGTAGVAWAWLIGHPVLVWGRQVHKVLGITGMDLAGYLRALWPAASSTAVMALAVVATRAAMPRAWPAGAALAGAVAAGTTAYLVTLVLLHGGRLRALRDVLRGTAP